MKDLFIKIKQFLRIKIFRRKEELVKPKPIPKPEPKPSKVSVTGITLDKTAVSISCPQDFLLNATIQPANATNKEIDWTSSSIMIATVTHHADNPCIGSVTGIAPGTAIIKAKTMDGGFEATCKVTVQ